MKYAIVTVMLLLSLLCLLAACHKEEAPASQDPQVTTGEMPESPSFSLSPSSDPAVSLPKQTLPTLPLPSDSLPEITVPVEPQPTPPEPEIA